MTLRDSGITAHEAEIRSKMSLSTLATLGIVSARKIQILAVQDHTVCISMAQAHITAPLFLFTSPSKAEQVIGFTYLRIFSFSVLHRPNTETLPTHRSHLVRISSNIESVLVNKISLYEVF